MICLSSTETIWVFCSSRGTEARGTEMSVEVAGECGNDLGHCKLHRNALGPAREWMGACCGVGRDGRGFLFTPVLPKPRAKK